MWLYQSFPCKIFMSFYKMNCYILLVETVHCTMYLALTYSFHEFSVLLSIKRSGLLLRYCTPICLMSKWWLGSLYNWWETAQKKQSPLSPTSTGLNPSWCNLKFNNIVDPADNIVWLFKFCSGPGFNSISPDVKSFILETQCLLVLLVDFVILWLFNQELLIRLLFCKGLMAVTLFSF